MSNFKNVLKVFKAMRDFDADDHALLNTLRNATEADFELLIETVGPVKRATKKAASKGTGKSRRAQGLGQRLVSSLESQRRATDTDDDNDGSDPSHLPLPCANCRQLADANVHHLPSASGYHGFVADTAKADDYQEQVGAVVGGSGD